jgi:hypothetical protein
MLDLPRVEYDDKDKKRIKKSDLELVNQLNAESELRQRERNRLKLLGGS